MDRERLRANIAAVEERICQACARAGRQRAAVTLVAVTKNAPMEWITALSDFGIFDLAENRPQALWSRAEAISKESRWHLIGHLQRNKIEKTLAWVSLIHSVDSIRLMQAIDQIACLQQRTIPILLEVNTSGEDKKQGFALSDGPLLTACLHQLKHVQVHGLMTMAALQDPQLCRPGFVALRELRDRLLLQGGVLHLVEHLSMGMSNDFEVAIEEGATLVRIGTALFTGL